VCSKGLAAQSLERVMQVQKVLLMQLRVWARAADSADDAAQAFARTLQVQKVVPMLPPRLCEELCSLNPGMDRLAFSVVWEMSAEGDVRRQWAGRSVIRSCAKLAYGDPQAMLEGRFGGAPGEAAPPVALEAPHTWPQARPGWAASAESMCVHPVCQKRPRTWPRARRTARGKSVPAASCWASNHVHHLRLRTWLWARGAAPGGQVSAERRGSRMAWRVWVQF